MLAPCSACILECRITASRPTCGQRLPQDIQVAADVICGKYSFIKDVILYRKIHVRKVTSPSPPQHKSNDSNTAGGVKNDRQVTCVLLQCEFWDRTATRYIACCSHLKTLKWRCFLKIRINMHYFSVTYFRYCPTIRCIKYLQERTNALGFTNTTVSAVHTDMF